MIELFLHPDDLANIRFARSPVEEALEGLWTLVHPPQRGMHDLWAAAVGPRVARLDIAMLRALLSNPHLRPNFLTPPLDRWDVEISEELGHLRAAEPAAVQSGVAEIFPDPPISLRPLYEDPQRHLGRLVDQLRLFWRTAIEPVWPRLRALHDADLEYRSRRMATGGLVGLFTDLHPRISYVDGTLRIQTPRSERRRLSTDGLGLLLVPCVFAWPRLVMSLDAARQPGLGYVPRGIGQLWSQPPDQAGPPLAELLGVKRAAVLAALQLPLSTTGLAKRLGVAAPTISHHLSVLRRCRLIASWRSGREVLYQRTELGTRLMGG